MARSAIFRREVREPRRRRWPGVSPTGRIDRRVLSDFAVASGASSATSHSITPTGQEENDWLVIFVCTVGGTATHANSAGGLTEVGTQVTQATTTTVSLWKKKCAAGESGTTYTWTVATGRRWAAIATCWTGADPTDVVDGSNVSSEGATAQQLDHNTLTPGAAQDWHIIGTASNTATPDDAQVSFTQPGGYEELAEIASGSATLANARASLAVRELPDTSATGVQSVTIAGGVDRALAGFEVVIRVPAEGGTPIALSDAGAGADSLQAAAAVPLAEAGSATHALQVAATVPLADSGTGADSVQVAAAVPLADAGAAADSILVGVPKALDDSASASDALTATASISLADAGAASDSLSVAATFSLADAGAGSDAISVDQSEQKPVADVGAGADALTIAAAVPLAEVGSGTDQLAVAQTRTLADTGAATDTLAVAQTRALADSGTAGDVLSVAAVVPLSDLGMAAESAVAAVLVALAEAAAASDVLVVTIPPPVPPPRWVEGATTANGMTEGAATGGGQVEGALAGVGVVEGASSL